MARQKIVIETPMTSLSLEQQEEIWRLSRTNDVFEKDVNGVLWQVLDLTDGEEEGVVLATRKTK